MSGHNRDEIAAILERMTALGLWEWRLHSFDGLDLRLIGGQGMVYSHHAEARFGELSFINCPVRMMHPRFRLATDHEAYTSGATTSMDAGSTAVAIECEAINSLSPSVFVIAAARVELKEETVVYSELRR
ncbi:MAG TPA: hypothetical protein VFJ16_08720 [Longimicrobium sp.]|nr:hypothetical protein [Longimicrobium sp.]